MTVEFIKAVHLIEGDLMNPTSNDLILQEGRLKVGLPVPNGWTVTTGNMHDSKVFRVAYRHQIDEENRSARY